MMGKMRGLERRIKQKMEGKGYKVKSLVTDRIPANLRLDVGFSKGYHFNNDGCGRIG